MANVTHRKIIITTRARREEGGVCGGWGGEGGRGRRAAGAGRRAGPGGAAGRGARAGVWEKDSQLGRIQKI